MSESNCLDKANAIVEGARRKNYGHPSENHTRTAKLWSAYLKRPISAQDVCILMVLLKVSRLAHDNRHEDSIVDVAGWIRNLEIVNEKPATDGVFRLSPIPPECSCGHPEAAHRTLNARPAGCIMTACLCTKYEVFEASE